MKLIAATIILAITSPALTANTELSSTLPAYSRDYDPQRDPFQDLAAATYSAEEHNRLILLIVGGYWCSWCHTLDDYLESNTGYAERFYRTFEVVKVYYGPENDNGWFLSKLPRIRGYPHFFIMDANYSLLGSQKTGELERASGFLFSSRHYETQQMETFLDEWEGFLQSATAVRQHKREKLQGAE